REVPNPVAGARTTAGDDVLDLQRHSRGTTIDTGVMKLLQQVCPDFIACERSLLILNAAYLRMLQRLQIESDQLLADGPDGCDALQPLHPGEDILDAALQGGWQPALPSTAVQNPGPAVAGVPRSPRTATSAALGKACFHLQAPMGKFRRPQHFPHLVSRP